MKNSSIKIFALRVLLLTAVFGLFGSKAWGTQNYYARLTVYVSNQSPSGSGKVYAGTSNAAPQESSYSSTSSQAERSTTTNGGTVTLYSFALASTGYHLSGWASTDGTTATVSSENPYGANYQASNTDNGRREHRIFAVFAINTYTVRYSSNGGSGTMQDQAFTYGQAQNLRTNLFSKDYTLTYSTNGGNAIAPTAHPASFLGWRSDGGQNYDPGQSVNNLTATHGATVTMSARWGNATVTLPSATKTLGGIQREFLGWYDAASGGNRLGGAGDQITLTGDTTIYAHWAEYNITVNVMCSGCTAGDRLILTLTRSGDPALSYTIPVVLTASSTVTTVLTGMPSGSYTVTANDWSWNYTLSPNSSTQTVSGNSTFNFSATSKHSSKEHDEKAKVNWGN